MFGTIVVGKDWLGKKGEMRRRWGEKIKVRGKGIGVFEGEHLFEDVKILAGDLVQKNSFCLGTGLFVCLMK